MTTDLNKKMAKEYLGVLFGIGFFIVILWFSVMIIYEMGYMTGQRDLRKNKEKTD